MSEDKKKYIVDSFMKIDIKITEEQADQLIKYYNILEEWNEVMNLTAITEFEDVVLKHFIDSISVVKFIDPVKYESVIDIGTGAGFPGIPLKIIFPHLKITLLDSLNKRIKFLNEIIDTLHLKDIAAIHGRAEEYAQNKQYREKYDLCVSRAVANLASLTEYCMGYVKVGGDFVPYKSGNIDQEVEKSKKAIYLMGGELMDSLKFELPGTDMGRSFLLIHKNKSTPKRYPRKAGTPGKEPLK